MLIYLEVDESNIDKQKLIEELRSRMADLVESKKIQGLYGIIVRTELLSSNPYISQR